MMSDYAARRTDEDLLRAFCRVVIDLKPRFPRWLAIASVADITCAEAKALCRRLGIDPMEKCQ